jgi:hypothetical protein
MQEQSSWDGSRLFTLLETHSSKPGATADSLVRSLGFDGRAVDFLHSGVSRDLDRWRRGISPHEALFADRGRVVRWGEATVSDYREYLAGLLRSIGVDHSGVLLKRRRHNPGRKSA